MGASAGGLEAFRELLSALPADTGMAFILVQHLDPTRPSLLADVLAPRTTMPVVEAAQGLEIRPNAVYLIPSGTALGVRAGRLELSPPATRRGVRLPVDQLFQSLAREYATDAVGVVLSGAGSDGSEGLRAIKAAGGLTIAQLPSSGQHAGMPESAIDTGVVDLVLPIGGIPAALQRFLSLPPEARQPSKPGTGAERQPDHQLPERSLRQLATVLDARSDVDLSAYKPGTIQRRVLRRMTLAGFENPDAYVERLRHDRQEQQALVRDLLISVTDFYRDGEAFEALSRSAIEPIVQRAAAGETVRIWVPGCATGEEAYSLAMAFLDAIERRGERILLQVFATDIDREALAIGRAGIYARAAVERLGPERLEKYFKPVEGAGFQALPVLRDTVSFAVHDVTKDPPFSRMHLVSCRNLLIYLQPRMQEHVLRVLHFSLLPDGVLFLGSSESTGQQRQLYSTLSKRWRLFRKVGASRPLVVPRSRLPGPDLGEKGRPAEDPAPLRPSPGELARRAVFQSRVPPTVVVGASGGVVFMHGELRPFFRFPDGEPRFDLSALVSPELSARVGTALSRSRRDRVAVVTDATLEGGDAARVRITATPAFELGDDAVILSFERIADAPAAAPESSTSEAVIDRLEKELAATREDLRTAVEQLEASNHELRSSNEESMSMNEELQSTNEELEATTEELRSLNEELTTLNAQLRDKVEQLEQAHDDLANFFASTKIATIFLDERLCIMRFTPAAEEWVRIDHADEGRFVGDIARELLQEGLVEDARSVLDHLATRTRELRTGSGRWVVRRVLPYRTEHRRIEGVVVTFTDITDLKETAARLTVRERQQAVIARLGLRALEEPDLQVFLDVAVREVQDTLASHSCEVLECQPGGDGLLLRAGIGWREGLVGSAIVSGGLDSQAGFTLTSKEPVIVRDLARERRFTGPALLVDHDLVSGLSCVIRSGDDTYGVLGAHTRSRRDFTAEDAHFLLAVAAVIGGAVSRHQTRVRLALENAVARGLADVSSLGGAIECVHMAAASVFGPGVGEYWQPTDDGLLARNWPFVSGLADPGRVAAELTGDRQPIGQGPVGQVFVSGEPAWLSALQDPPHFDRARAVRTLGLRAGVAFAIRGAAGPIGVVTYFSAHPLHADPVMLRSLESIGRTVGDFAHRVASDHRIRATVERAPVGIADRTLDGRWLRVNDRFCEIVGYPSDALVGRRFTDIVHPEDVEREQGLIAAMQAGRIDRYALEKRYLHAGGGVVWVSIGAARVPGPAGEDYCVVVIEDISARLHAEEELRSSESRFRAVLRHSPVPLMLYDSTGRILEISESWTELFGYTLEEIPTADRWVEVAYRDRAPEMRDMAERVWNAAPATHRYEHRVWTKAGEERVIQLSAVPLGTSPDGRQLRVAAALDLTRQRRYEHEVDRASRQKDDFIAMLSHELRNPLAAVRTATEVLKGAGITHPLAQRTLSVLERQSTHMAKLLDGLLDISRIVRGKFDVERLPVDLAAVVREVAGDHAERLMAAGVDVEVDAAAGAWPVLGDRVRLTQVVDNLLTNAGKFTQSPGRITVSLRTEGAEAVLRVRDTGIGIAPHLLPQVFDVFQQGAQQIDRARGGLGLGLALVKLLVEIHGGRVEAHSEGIGRGAEFVVRLPLTEAAPQVSPAAAPSSAPRRVVVIEDNADAAEMLQLALELYGHEVFVARSGEAGLELAREHEPDLVLCDIGLPGGMTGYEVAAALRQAAPTRSLRIVALSGYGQPEDRRRSAAAGFDVHLTKPVGLDDLLRLFDDEGG